MIECKSKDHTQEFLNEIRNDSFISGSLPVYRMPGSIKRNSFNIITDEFVVKLDERYTEQDLNTLNDVYDVEVISSNKFNEYLLRQRNYSNLTSLQLANIYYESPVTKWSHPDFIGDLRPNSDPYYQEQYYLKNTGQGGGLPGTDINVEPVWNYTKGISDIIVAVLDDGVMQHEDFYSGQIITGYSPHGGTDPPTNAAHGMNCAGIIAANHNEVGVRGIAPNVKIMPIRFVYSIITTSQVAFSIDWAYLNGADILSNSWGYGGTGTWYDNIAEAIGRAQSEGRGNLGSLVVFSAGNTGSYTQFPANVSGVVTVGAVDKHNNRWYYSPNDNRVDIVAPSGDLYYGGCDHRGDMWSTDRHPDGYSPCGGNFLGDSGGKYFSNFGGTSGAAPEISAVAALLLSTYQNINVASLRSILYNTADDYGSTNWDGSGKVNAFNAFIEIRDWMHLEALNNDATALNGGRKITKSEDGVYHLVYENAGAIYYSFSTDNGNNWGGSIRLTSVYDLNFEAKYPSISTHNDYIFVTWQIDLIYEYEIVTAFLLPNETTWKYIVYSETSDVEPIPVIVAADNVDNNYQSGQGAPEVMIAYRKSDGIYHQNSFYLWVSGKGYHYFGLTTSKIPGTFSGQLKPSIAINGAGKIMLTCNSSWSLYTFTSTGGSWSAFPSSIFNVGGVIYPKYSSVTIDGLDDFQISWEGYKYTYGTDEILHKKILSNGGTGTPITEFRHTGPNNDSHQPSTFGHIDGNGGVSIYWFTDGNEIKRVENDGTGWDYSGFVFFPSIQTDASYVNSISKDNPNDYAYSWTSTGEAPYDVNISIYDETPPFHSNSSNNGGMSPTMNSDSVKTYRSAEYMNSELDVVLALQIGNFTIVDEDENRYQLDVDRLDPQFTFEKFKDILETVLSDSIPNTSNLNSIEFDYSITTKNLFEIKAGNSNVKVKFILKNRRNGNSHYSSEYFILPEDSSLTTLSGTLEIPLNRLNENNDLSVKLKLTGVKQSYLNQSENINLINTYLYGSGSLGKKSIKNDEITVKEYFNLEQNYPNPFNPITTIKYSILDAGVVSLKVYDILGKEVAVLVNEDKPAGSYVVEFDAGELASGIYIYRLTSGQFTSSKKLILLK